MQTRRGVKCEICDSDSDADEVSNLLGGYTVLRPLRLLSPEGAGSTFIQIICKYSGYQSKRDY